MPSKTRGAPVIVHGHSLSKVFAVHRGVPCFASSAINRPSSVAMITLWFQTASPRATGSQQA
jgi:hypothetical protein